MYIQVYPAQDPVWLSELAQGHKHNVCHKTHNATAFLICLPCGVKTEKGIYKGRGAQTGKKTVVEWQLVASSASFHSGKSNDAYNSQVLSFLCCQQTPVK